MPVTEPRGRIPAVSATLAANETLERRREAGAPVLPLAFGEAGLPVHPELRRELAAAAGQGGYGPVAGSAELREAAAGYWRRRGVAADPDLVVAGPGSKPLLYALLVAIGGDVVIPRPSWVSYAAQTRLAGNEPILVPTLPGEGGVPDPDQLTEAVMLARAEGREVGSVVITTPDNPTGTLAASETVRALCEAARRLDLVIVADQIYRDLVFDRPAQFPCPSRYAPERTVLTTALSKSLALGGWRLGAALLPDAALGRALRTRLAGIASEIWSSPSAPVQQAAAYAFGEPRALVERVTASRRLHGLVARAVAERFAEAGARVIVPQGGFYFYPDLEDLREPLGREHGVGTGADLARLLLEEFGVGVIAGGQFGDDPHALRVRVATSMLYGESDEQRETALAAVDPLGLPWIAAALDRTTEVLTALSAPAPVAVSA